MSTLQGWNPDPFGRFEDRYFSDGAPTPLVRSGSVETRDEPGARTEEPDPETADPRPAPREPRPHLYERRDRRFLAVMLLAAAIVLPFVAWELLATSSSDRLFGAAAFGIIAVTLAAVVRIFRVPRTDGDRHRPFGSPTITR
jgi:hypothetical protein